MTRRIGEPRTFGVRKTLLFSTLLIVLFFAVAEVTLRGWVYFFRSPAERFDLASGTFELVSGSHRRVGGEPVLVNSRGFVGEEFDDPKTPGMVRFASLGDSCTFGQGTALGAYPAYLQRLLNGDGDGETVRYQVVNAGIEGLNSELALRRLKTKVLPYRPEVLTVYLGWNDLMKFDPTGHGKDPGVAVMAQFIDQLWLTKGLRKLMFYYLRPRILEPKTGPTSRTGIFRDYRPAVFERNLRAIIAAGRGAGARVVVLTLPSVISDDMTAADLRRFNVVFPYFPSAYGVGDFIDLIQAYNKAIRRVAADENAPLVDLAAEIDVRPDRRALFLDTMHPNQQGHQLIARILQRHLETEPVQPLW